MKMHSHRTVRYLFDRFIQKTRVSLFYNNHPWLNHGALKILEDIIKPTDIVLETGSGRSTSYFCQKASQVVSFEHNELWFNKVSQQCIEYIKSGQLRYNLCKTEGAYVDNVKKISTEKFDFILIDGKHRGKIANLALDMVASNGVICIDDGHRYITYKSLRCPDKLGSGIKYADEYWKNFWLRPESCG